MKIKTVMLFAVICLLGISATSCNKRCKGGGWYGDRNLGYAPVKQQAEKSLFISEKTSEIECETVEP